MMGMKLHNGLGTLAALLVTAATVAQSTSGAPEATAAVKHGKQTYTIPLVSSAGAPAGQVMLKQEKKGVKMTVKLENLPIGVHAIHIHANPVCEAPDFKSAGGHFNPTLKQHGFMNPAGHHAGDTPENITVQEDHHGEASFLLKDISLSPGLPTSVPGTTGVSFIVHEHADDMKTDPSGNSGNRIACGVLKP